MLKNILPHLWNYNQKIAIFVIAKSEHIEITKY